ncbi:hypothetical protein BN946_scf184970.g53 [Trametes cinnabarina]|uniref:CCHC-type domain-containing protein n=1 Tax=Pycnoporus cinnabarinus TaxID=5643 RepID=A0A060SD92_PYCCI|nr:hypothetical protein BN946_scf184970.g53 [Trametes cinnabarina]
MALDPSDPGNSSDPTTLHSEIQRLRAELEQRQRSLDEANAVINEARDQFTEQLEQRLRERSQELAHSLEGRLVSLLERALIPSQPRSPRGVKAEPPEPFDGSMEKFDDFFNQLTVVFDADEETYGLPIGSKNRILYALSFLKTGRAAAWRTLQVEKYGREGYPSWEDFASSLRDQFGDPDPRTTAQIRIARLSMETDRLTADEYINAFEQLEHRTEFGEEALRVQFRRGLPAWLLDKLTNLPTPPTTLAATKYWARHFDREHRRREEERHRFTRDLASRGRGTNPAPARASPTPSAAMQTSRAAPSVPQAASASPTTTSTDRRDSTGVTFGGTGQPMDIDAARRRGMCFTCGQRGHIQRDCPNRKIVVRNLVQQLSVEDRSELLKELGASGTPATSGFQEGRE